VLLVLLIIMMLYTGGIGHGVGLDLAVVSHPISFWFAPREDAIRVAITRDDNLFFGGSKVSAADIPLKIRESIKNGSEKRIYLQVDGRAKYGIVKPVLDEIRDARVERVSFLAYQKR
jgi:biopolymer transport protein ExbD